MRPEDEQQYRRFLRIYNETDTIFSAYGRTHGLSPAAFSILYSLSLESRPQSQAELCRSWSLARQTVNSAVRTLKANGLVRLEPLTGQGRRKALVLTDQGKEYCRQQVQPLVEADQQAFFRLDAARRAVLLETMAEYNDLLRGTVSRLP